MNTLKPYTDYRIVVVKLAVPYETALAYMYDGLNELLRPALMDEEAIFDDYTIGFTSDVRRTDIDPSEVDIFHGEAAFPGAEDAE